MPSTQRPATLFLDAGVLIDGFFNPWGSCKGILILTTLRSQFRAVLAEPIYEEIVRNIERKAERLTSEDRARVFAGLEGWMARARPNRLPWPSPDEMREHADLLAVVRHRNDMPAVVAAVVAHPRWVLSTNTAHWNTKLAERTGLRITSPAIFLASLQP